MSGEYSDDEPTAGSNGLVKSGGVTDRIGGTFEVGKYLNSDGTTTNDANWSVSEFIPVVAGQVYTFYSGIQKINAYLCVYDNDGSVIDYYNVRHTSLLRQVTIRTGGVKIKFSFYFPNIFECSVYDNTAAKTLWTPSLSYKVDTLKEKLYGIDANTWVVYNVNTAAALKETLISLMSVAPEEHKWYKINVAAGTYNMDVSGDTVPGSNGIFIMPNCVLNGAGKDKTILQFHYSGSDSSVMASYSTLNSPYTCQVRNLTLSAQNIRYAFHSDGELSGMSLGRDDTEMLFENVKFVHLGFNKPEYSVTTTYNSGDFVKYSGGIYECTVDNTVGVIPTNTSNWSYVYYSPDAFGSGIKSGCKRIFIGCDFIGSERAPFFCHNSVNQTKEYSIVFDSCIFEGITGGPSLSHRASSIALEGYGTTAKGRCVIKNCEIKSFICVKQASNSVTTLDWEVSCDDNHAIWAQVYNDAYKDKYYTKNGIYNAVFTEDTNIGTPVMRDSTAIGNAIVWDGVSPLYGILINNVDVSEDNVGRIATIGCKIPLEQILGTSFAAGSSIGYNDGSWVAASDTVKPLLYTEDGLFGYLLDYNIGERLFNVEKDVKSIKGNFDNVLYLPDDEAYLGVGLLKKSEEGIVGPTDTRYRYTKQYYAVTPGEIIRCNCKANGSAAAIVFYDSTKNRSSVIESSVSTLYDTTVPIGASFARFSTERYSTVGMSVTILASENSLSSRVTGLETSVDSLNERVTDIENTIPETVILKQFDNANQNEWIDDDVASEFTPKTRKLDYSYKGDINFQKRYIAIGFDDFRDSDFNFIIPLLAKYGFRAEFNQVRRAASPTDDDIQKVNNVIYSGNEIGDHTWMHYKFPFDEPLFNGQDPSSPEGSQIPFPSNSQMRNDRGDGKNAFGHLLTDNVKTTIGYQAPDINTTWGEMTDAQCQQLRDYFSIMKDTSTDLITLLDTLSNTYLGTTGNSIGSWNNTTQQYDGGIFTGCKTSANHEVWERILFVTNLYMKDKYGLNYQLQTWSLPGSKSSSCYFESSGKKFYDSAFTIPVNNLAKFTSSLYKDNAGNYISRSWTDVLREFGYTSTHDAAYPGRYDGQSVPVMREQYTINGKASRPDALIFPSTRSFSFSTIASEYTQGTDLTGTAPYEVQMYESNGSFKTAIEAWRKKTAQGCIHGEVIDSADTWSERMILEGLLKYCKAVGIEVITKAEAYDICFNHIVTAGNLFGNPNLRNTVEEFIPSASNLPTNPDGFEGDCEVIKESGERVLHTNGIVDYIQFGIPIGKLNFSAEVKGSGTISFYAVKNSHRYSYITTDMISESLGTITIESANAYNDSSLSIVIPDNDIVSYEGRCAGYGDKIIALCIRISAGLYVKNIKINK